MASFSIVTNIGAVNAQNKLTSNNLGMANTISRLSSGLRINGAKDDAAGLAIAENLRADVSGLNQAVRNANDGIGIINTADAALGEVGNLLQRAVTLAEQASSGTSGADAGTAKKAINAEYQQILSEIDRISSTVSFNGVSLFGASGATVDVQIGTGSSSNDKITLTTSGLSSTGLGLTTGAATTSLQSASGAAAELVKIQDAIDTISQKRGDLGASYNRLEHTIASLGVSVENLTAAESTIRDVDFATESTKFSRNQILSQSSQSMLSQANQLPQGVMSLLR